MIRGAATAGLSLTLGLIGVSAFAGPASAAPAATTHTTAATATKPTAGGTGSGGLPIATQQCAPNPKYKAQSGTPWAQKVLDYPSLPSLSQGAGITVAVIDSGVDANSQFAGRVQVGNTAPDAKASSGPANSDCEGHGTMVAGLIAAQPTPSTPFVGIAPQAHVLSFKVTNNGQVQTGDMVSAINDAVAAHVQVINISIDEMTNDPSLKAAVANAVSHNIVVVVAAGNDEAADPSQGVPVAQHGPFFPSSYSGQKYLPSSYAGVLSVGALDQQDNLASYSDKVTPASVSAPGSDVTSTFPSGSGDAYAADDGTSFAAPLTAGLAALVRSKFPNLSAAQVVQRIEETADGSVGAGSGNGLINPVQALTAVLPAGRTSGAAAGKPGAVTVDQAPPQHNQKLVAVAMAGGALAVAVIVIAAAIVIPAGRKRRWRAG